MERIQNGLYRVDRGRNGLAQIVQMRQLTVSWKVAVCESDPDVPVTVTVDVTGCDPPEPPTLDVAPHPLSRPRPATLTASSRSICQRRRFLNPKQHSTAASAEAGSSGMECLCIAADVAEVDTVSVVYETPAGVGTVSKEKLHAAPVGSPEQANETLESNPYSSCNVTVVVPLCPPWTEMDVGFTEMLKSGVATSAFDVLPVKFESPL